MSFTKSFRQKVRAVRIRCSLNLLLHQIGRVLAIAGAIAIVAALAEKLLALPVRIPPLLWVFSVAAVLSILIPWILRMPSRMQASLLLDERLRLSERFSTTLALAQSDDPFAKAARAESLRVVQQANLKGHFPVGLSRSWFYGAGTWVVAIVLLLFLPQRDLLGFMRQRQATEQKTRQLEEAKADVQLSAESIKSVVKQLGDPNLTEELRKLDDLAQANSPQEVKREAIKALGDLAEKVKQMQNNAEMNAADMLKQRLKNLHGSVDPFGQQLRLALAKGNFNEAADMLRQMQKEMANGTIPDEMQKKLAEQLEQLAQELQKLAQDKSELESELAKLGLDKKLAQMNSQQLQQALQKQGLSKELIEQLMKKAEASQSAMSQCAALGQAMGIAGMGAGGGSGDALGDAIEQLSAMEAWEQQALMLQASLGEISRCMGGLGQGMGAGQSDKWGINFNDTPSGQGDGIGFGPASSYSTPQDINGQTKTTRAPSQSQGGPMVASWYFQEAQVKGEARREFSEVVQAGRASAAEAISENEIPRRYEGPVKEYFNQLEASADQ